MPKRFLGATAMVLLLAGGLVAASGVAPPPALASAGDRSASDGFYQDARKYLEKGDANAAVIQLKNALQRDPNNVAARKLLGEIYLRSGNGPSAEITLKAAQRRGAEGREIDLMIAQAYLLQGKFREVLSELKDDVSDDRMRAETLLVRARAELGLGQFAEARKAFEVAERLLPEDVRPKVGVAQVLVNQGMLREAEEKVDAALAVQQDSVDALVLKGELRRLGRDLEGAVSAFDAALRQNVNNLPARLGRAAALIDLNRDDHAQADIQAVFQRVPQHPLASYLSALILSKKKDFAGAEEALQQAGALLDNHMPSIFLRGAVSYALNRLEQAASSLERYVAAVPGNPRARKLLGATLVRMNQPQRAIDTLTPLVGTSEADAQTLSLLGSAYMRAGQYAEGTAFFEQAAQAAPDMASIRTQLALGHLATGASDRAVGDLQAAVDLDPEARQASVLLTLVRLRQGEFDEALKSAEQLRRSMPDNPLPGNLIGAAYLGKGDLDRARETFEEALKANPDFHPARMNLAQLDLRQDRMEAAKKQYETILRQDPKHVGAMMALADIAARERQNDAVLGWLQKAAEADPASVAPRLRLVQHYGQTRDFARALVVARDLNSKVPDNPQVLEALGRAESAAGESSAAVSTFRRLVAAAPTSPRAHSLLAGAQMSVNDIGGARASYERAIELQNDFMPAYMALVELESRAGNTDKALRLAAVVRDTQPESAAGDMLAGDVHMRAGEHAKALDKYETAIAKEDTGILALRRYNAEQRARDTAAALERLQGWVDRNDDRAVRHVLASGYITAGKYDAAIRESEYLLKDDAENPVLLNNLAWLYDQRGDDRALPLAEKAHKIAPSSPAIMDTLGWILVRRGDNARGVQLLDRAHAAAPNQGDIAYHYAVALSNVGRKAEALRVLQRSLAANEQFAKAEAARKLLKELGG